MHCLLQTEMQSAHVRRFSQGIIAAIMDFTLAIQQAMRETFKSIDWMAGEEESEAVKTELKDDCHALRKAAWNASSPQLMNIHEPFISFNFTKKKHPEISVFVWSHW